MASDIQYSGDPNSSRGFRHYSDKRLAKTVERIVQSTKEKYRGFDDCRLTKELKQPEKIELWRKRFDAVVLTESLVLVADRTKRIAADKSEEPPPGQGTFECFKRLERVETFRPMANALRSPVASPTGQVRR
jgi:hypothetical protein